MSHSSPYGPAGGGLTGSFPNPVVSVEESSLLVGMRVFATRQPTTAAAAAAAGGLVNFTEAANTTGTNASRPTNSLSVVDTTSAGFVGIALVPLANGSLMASIPDGASTGGNTRGNKSVDWQQQRSTAARVASGSQSTIVGGGDNTAFGSNSVVGGQGNTASGQAGTVFGQTNSSNANYGTISGGTGNAANTGAYATVVGGTTNNSTGSASTSGGDSNTASGDQSFAINYNNTASGQYASAFGYGNLASSTFSVVFGRNCTTRAMLGAMVHSSGQPTTAVQGYNQSRHATLQVNTSDTTSTALTTDGGAAGTTNQFAIPNNQCLSLRGQVVVWDATNGKCGRFNVEGVARNVATTMTLAGSAVGAYSGDASLNTCTVTVAVDTTNKAIQINVTGVAATALNWCFEGWTAERG